MGLWGNSNQTNNGLTPNGVNGGTCARTEATFPTGGTGFWVYR